MKSKFIYLGIFFSSVVLLFLSFLYRYQIIDNQQYRDYIDKLATRQNQLRSLRGNIYDRNKDVPLAMNVSAYRIIMDTKKFPMKERAKLVKDLSLLLNVSENFIYSVLDEKKKEIVPQVLLDNLQYEEVINIVEKIGNFPGVTWQRVINRYYPHNSSMSHIIGFIGKITDTETRLLNYEGYTVYDEIGKAGIEKEYEKELRGQAGQKKELVNVFGEKIEQRKEIVETVKHGHNLILSIDRNIQEIVEKAIGDRVGAAVILKPHSGEILSMVSYPRFNPNILSLSSDKKLISDIISNVNSPFFNRAIQASTSPASTFKVLMALAFLQEYPRQWDYSIYDEGYITIGDRVFSDWYRLGRGWVSISDALAYSNNTFYYSIGVDKLGISNIVQYSSFMGLGKKTNIDLPGEVKGTIPSPRWKFLRYRKPWLAGDTANISIGQGYLSTTLIQLANLTAGIVNEGTIYTPHLLKEVREQISGTVIKKIEPEVLYTIDTIDKKVFKRMKKDMRGVVQYGTAEKVITTDAVAIAAKTGTGQVYADVSEPHFNSMFISYAPYDAPVEDQIVLAIWIDAVNEWEWWAPKAANIIYHAIFTDSTYEEALKSLKDKGTWYLYE